VKIAGRERRIAYLVLCVASYAGKLPGCFINIKHLKERLVCLRKTSRWCRKSDVLYGSAVSYCLCELLRNPVCNYQTSIRPLRTSFSVSVHKQKKVDI